MKKLTLPCEILMWNVVPAIRKEIALLLIKEYKLSQREVSKLLGISEAAISQYRKNKRGRMIKLNKEDVKELKRVAEKIAKGSNEKEVINLLCNACKVIGTRVVSRRCKV